MVWPTGMKPVKLVAAAGAAAVGQGQMCFQERRPGCSSPLIRQAEPLGRYGRDKGIPIPRNCHSMLSLYLH